MTPTFGAVDTLCDVYRRMSLRHGVYKNLCHHVNRAKVFEPRGCPTGPILASRPYSDDTSNPSNKVKAKAADRDFIVNVLSATTTRREAKSYLSRFKPTERGLKQNPWRKDAIKDSVINDLDHSGVNLGNFYATTQAAKQTPQFTRNDLDVEKLVPSQHLGYLSIVKIRDIQVLDDGTVQGICSTLSQLARLGMISIVVPDCGVDLSKSDAIPFEAQSALLTQANRIASFINAHEGTRGRVVEGAFGLGPGKQPVRSLLSSQGHVVLDFPEILVSTLQTGALPIIPSIVYTSESNAKVIDADELILAMAKSLGGLPKSKESEWLDFSLERLIILDPLGGILAPNAKGSHVFINLEQEFEAISMSLEQDAGAGQHSKNLRLVKNAAALLPPTFSALITTPAEAAMSANFATTPGESFGVSTRRVKNPLIHNLLTDKPAFSSSLPAARMSSGTGTSETISKKMSLSSSTFIKRGMPLAIIPNPSEQPWVPPAQSSETLLNLASSQIALPRLVHLIEDSFARSLDVRHYLARIDNRTAGVIIAGEYEGGAVLTWEVPSFAVGQSDNAVPPVRWVPYLDKFAVLQRSQGSGASVADVVFKAMVRDCFPSGVVWRSRKNNPVNKWYFERSVGTWKIPGTNWCMFWTTEGIFNGNAEQFDHRWEDYVDVCKNVQPSWADSKAAD
ncbi:MAG: Amino-acid acetyltransferase, mitochondrial [Bogoriella megaspora]|nr:MAG: Amino-acid acetyltransferase, mitochondrial [Bogoriella megaspora]